MEVAAEPNLPPAVKETNGGAAKRSDSGSASPPPHNRSTTLNDDDLLDEPEATLHHANIDHKTHSLPSVEHVGDETAGMSSSVTSSNQDGMGNDASIPSEVLGALSNPTIEDDTPAAEALRANAEIRVHKLGKLARKVHAQSVRRLVKKATLRAKSGNVRGKPPRIPPPRHPSDIVTGPDNEMYVVKEEDESIEDDAEHELDSSIESSEQDEMRHDQQVELFTAGARLEDLQEVEDDVAQPDELSVPTDGRIPADLLMATSETGKKVLGNVDPHDILSTHRWKRRKRRGGKDRRKSYVKGKVITRQHELYTLSIAVMFGVRTSIGTTNSRMGSSHGKRWLTSDDFMASAKYEFSPKGGPHTPPHQLSHTFKFKDYSPMAFAYLRRMFGVNEFDFLLSVCGNANFIEFISNAKSGQFFFYSSDGKYMIKTMTNAESKFLRRILPHYFRHCSRNPNTLLTKFLGMYRVKMYHIRRNVKFVIMNSVYYTDKHLQTFYDLKGSVLGRQAKPHQDVKKDNDLRRGMPNSAIALEPEVRERMREQVVADCEFMRRMDIMDYSMLIGVHHIPPAQDHSQASDSIAKTGFSLPSSKKRWSLKELMKSKLKAPTAELDSQNVEGNVLTSPSLRNVPAGSKAQRASSQAVSPVTCARPSGQSPVSSAKGVRSAGQSISSTASQNLPHERSKDSVRPKTSLEEQLFSLQLYDLGYDDDDDCSYLEGSEEFKVSHERRISGDESVFKLGASALSKMDDIEHKKAQTVEQIYWPFHRYYDINGYRRMGPSPCRVCDKVDCSCGREQELLLGIQIPPFVAPLSRRKDGGLMMDTTGFDMPIKVELHGKEQTCEGKIFFMGIIDILQQYNIRKRFEARYRRLYSAGWQDASCVCPKIYAQRFVQFFDEYSQRGDLGSDKDGKQEKSEDNGLMGKDGEPTGGSWESVKISGSSVSDDIEVSQLKND